MTDFRDPARREHFVYRAYDRRGRLLYVGCTMRLKLRWAEHRAWSAWARQAVRFRVAGPYNYDTGRRLEREALATEHPLFGFTPARRAAANRSAARSRRRLRDALACGLSLTDAVAKAVSA